MAPPLLLLVLRCPLAGPRRVAEPRASRWRSLAPTGGALLGTTLLLVLLIAPSTVVAVATAATFTLTPLPLPPPPRLGAEEAVDWQEGEVQEGVVKAASANAEASLPLLPRRSSLMRSMLVAALKSGSGDVLAMMSAVLAKQGLIPRRRLSTSYEGEMV